MAEAPPTTPSVDFESWQFEVPSDTIPEIKAMSVIVGMSRHLEANELARALRWAVERFGDGIGSSQGPGS